MDCHELLFDRDELGTVIPREGVASGPHAYTMGSRSILAQFPRSCRCMR